MLVNIFCQFYSRYLHQRKNRSHAAFSFRRCRFHWDIWKKNIIMTFSTIRYVPRVIFINYCKRTKAISFKAYNFFCAPLSRVRYVFLFGYMSFIDKRKKISILFIIVLSYSQFASFCTQLCN